MESESNIFKFKYQQQTPNNLEFKMSFIKLCIFYMQKQIVDYRSTRNEEFAENLKSYKLNIVTNDGVNFNKLFEPLDETDKQHFRTILDKKRYLYYKDLGMKINSDLRLFLTEMEAFLRCKNIYYLLNLLNQCNNIIIAKMVAYIIRNIFSNLSAYEFIKIWEYELICCKIYEMCYFNYNISFIMIIYMCYLTNNFINLLTISIFEINSTKFREKYLEYFTFTSFSSKDSIFSDKIENYMYSKEYIFNGVLILLSVSRDFMFFMPNNLDTLINILNEKYNMDVCIFTKEDFKEHLDCGMAFFDIY